MGKCITWYPYEDKFRIISEFTPKNILISYFFPYRQCCLLGSSDKENMVKNNITVI